MPIYEYDCFGCNTLVEIFFRSFADLETKEIICPTCEGTNLERRISQVSVVNTNKRDYPGQSTATASAQTTDDKLDSKVLAQTMHRTERTAGQDLGAEFKEVANRLEKGETATSIEKSLRKRVGQSMGTH